MAVNVDICIRGGGIVGKTLALLLSRLQLRVALVDTDNKAGNFLNLPNHHIATKGVAAQSESKDACTAKVTDIRAYALNAKSKSLLESVHAWPEDAFCTEVKQIRVHSDEGELIEFAKQAHSPEGANALTWIVEVSALEAELERQLTKAVDANLIQRSFDSGAVSQDHPLGVINAPLTVICEGTQSTAKQKLDTSTKRIAYGQIALATHVKFKNPQHKHFGIAHQWFNTLENTPSTPASHAHPELEILALLPIGGREGDTFAVVWSASASRCKLLKELSDDEFTDAICKSSRGLFADLVPIADRQSWPLALSSVDAWCGVFNQSQSWVLCGDSAHSVHPLSGMGLNLGLGDVGALFHLLQSRELSKSSWRPLSDLRLLRSYERERKLAIYPYVQFIDKIQLLFASDYPVARFFRNKGFKAFNALGSLKEWTIKKAMQANY